MIKTKSEEDRPEIEKKLKEGIGAQQSKIGQVSLKIKDN